jgi:hypothetical protein
MVAYADVPVALVPATDDSFPKYEVPPVFAIAKAEPPVVAPYALRLLRGQCY